MVDGVNGVEATWNESIRFGLVDEVLIVRQQRQIFAIERAFNVRVLPEDFAETRGLSKVRLDLSITQKKRARDVAVPTAVPVEAIEFLAVLFVSLMSILVSSCRARCLSM